MQIRTSEQTKKEMFLCTEEKSLAYYAVEVPAQTEREMQLYREEKPLAYVVEVPTQGKNLGKWIKVECLTTVLFFY